MWSADLNERFDGATARRGLSPADNFGKRIDGVCSERSDFSPFFESDQKMGVLNWPSGLPAERLE